MRYGGPRGRGRILAAMGRAWGVAALAVVGCSSGKPGLAIEVPLDSGSAELFVPHDACGSGCGSGIAPRGAASQLVSTGGAGDVTFLDSTERLVAERQADGYARFQLEPGDRGTLPAIYIVGFDDAGKPTGFAEVDNVAVPAHDGERWRVLLEPATFGPAQGSGDTIWVWRQPLVPPYNGDPQHASCLGIQHADGTTQFYVPSDDPDCDGVPTGDPLECNAFWFEYETPPNMTDKPCTTQVATGNGEQVCEVGRPVNCADAIGPGCGPFTNAPMCVPDATCTICGAAYTSLCFPGLFADSSVPRLHCQFPVQANGAVCAGASLTTVDLGGVLPIAACNGLGFTAGMPANMPMPSLGVPAVSPTAFVTASGQTNNCNFSITWSGTVAVGQHASAMFELDLANGARLVFPFQIDFNGDCTVAMPKCVIEPTGNTDHMWSCAP